MNKEKKRFLSIMVFPMLLWAGSWISGRLLSVQGNPLIIIFWRFLFTFAAFLPFLFIKRREISKIKLSSFLYTLGAAFLVCFYNICFLEGLKSSLAGKGGVLVTTTNPLFAFLISLLVLRKKSEKKQIIGLFLGLIGGMILVEPWTWQKGTINDWSNLIFLLAALSWATMTFFGQFAQKKLHPYLFNPLLYLLATIISFFMLPENWIEISKGFNISFWVNIVYLAVGAGAIGAGMYFIAASRLGAATASTVTFMVPVLAVLLSWLVLHEQPEWQTILGGSISILAVLIIHGRIRIRQFQTSG